MPQSLEELEETLLPLRKQLHQLLGLPMDRPMLRMANALAFDAAGEAYLQPAQSPEPWAGAGVISAILRLPSFHTIASLYTVLALRADSAGHLTCPAVHVNI